MCLNAAFIPFDADVVATGAQLRRLIGVPVLHTFWMECADLDSYKVSCPCLLINNYLICLILIALFEMVDAVTLYSTVFAFYLIFQLPLYLTQAFVRDEIMSWMTLLRKCGAATDWAVVIVEPADTKKTNKSLPRTSVLDKLKTDVGGKQPERCISLIGETCSQWQGISVDQ